MSDLTQVEVNCIREIVTSHQTMAAKFSSYANQCQDAQIKQMFSKSSTDSLKSANDLIQMLQ